MRGPVEHRAESGLTGPMLSPRGHLTSARQLRRSSESAAANLLNVTLWIQLARLSQRLQRSFRGLEVLRSMSDSARRENDQIPFLRHVAPTFPRRPEGIDRIRSALSTTFGFILLGAILLVVFLLAMASASRSVRGGYEPSNQIECVRSSCLPLGV